MDKKADTIDVDDYLAIDFNVHIHKDWFEVKEELDIYTGIKAVTIMCPEGCRRQLRSNGEVLEYDKKQELWVERK